MSSRYYDLPVSSSNTRLMTLWRFSHSSFVIGAKLRTPSGTTGSGSGLFFFDFFSFGFFVLIFDVRTFCWLFSNFFTFFFSFFCLFFSFFFSLFFLFRSSSLELELDDELDDDDDDGDRRLRDFDFFFFFLSSSLELELDDELDDEERFRDFFRFLSLLFDFFILDDRDGLELLDADRFRDLTFVDGLDPDLLRLDKLFESILNVIWG